MQIRHFSFCYAKVTQMSIFTRRHYDFLTETTKQIAEALENDSHYAEKVVHIIADNLANESLGFDKALFLDNVFPKQP